MKKVSIRASPANIDIRRKITETLTKSSEYRSLRKPLPRRNRGIGINGGPIKIKIFFVLLISSILVLVKTPLFFRYPSVYGGGGEKCKKSLKKAGIQKLFFAELSFLFFFFIIWYQGHRRNDIFPFGFWNLKCKMDVRYETEDLKRPNDHL